MPNSRTDRKDNIREIIDLIDSIDFLEKHHPSAPSRRTESIAWLSKASGKAYPTLSYPRLAVFVGNHGFAKKDDMEYVNNYISTCSNGTHTLNRLADHANCDLRIYELTPASSELPDILKTGNAAQSDSDLCRSLAYGMMAIEPEIDLFAATSLGTGSAESAAAIIAAHVSPQDENNVQNITEAGLLSLNKGKKGLECLAAIGGPEISALCGVILAARLARIPVLLEGPQGYAALLILEHHCPHIGEHCALTGRFDESFPAPEHITILPPPYDSAKETGTSAACLIAMLRNEIALDKSEVCIKR